MSATGRSGIDAASLPPRKAELEWAPPVAAFFHWRAAPVPLSPQKLDGISGERPRQHRAGRHTEAEPAPQCSPRNPQHERRSHVSVCFESRRSKRQVSTSNAPSRSVEPASATDDLGMAYRRYGLWSARRRLQQVLSDDPDFPRLIRTRIDVDDAGTPSDALPHLERAAALRPDNPRCSGESRLGTREASASKSLAHAQRAVELDPNHGAAPSQLANALAELGDRSGAIASYRRAVELDPTDYDAHRNLILVALTDPRFDAAQLFTEARAWAKQHAEPLRDRIRPHQNDKAPERRLRIGYVSSDFRAHPVRHFLMPLLQHVDHAQFETFLYSSVDRPTSRPTSIAAWLVIGFARSGGWTTSLPAELVRPRWHRYLVDLTLHGTGRRLRIFACKPAPVQSAGSATWGPPASTPSIRKPMRTFDPPGRRRLLGSVACDSILLVLRRARSRSRGRSPAGPRRRSRHVRRFQ